jgi:hypothetical protein
MGQLSWRRKFPVRPAFHAGAVRCARYRAFSCSSAGRIAEKIMSRTWVSAATFAAVISSLHTEPHQVNV